MFISMVKTGLLYSKIIHTTFSTKKIRNLFPEDYSCYLHIIMLNQFIISSKILRTRLAMETETQDLSRGNLI